MGGLPKAYEGAPPILAENQPRRRREITADHLKSVAAQYEQHKAADQSPLKELARDYSVNASTVSRWVKEARERGYIDEKA